MLGKLVLNIIIAGFSYNVKSMKGFTGNEAPVALIYYCNSDIHSTAGAEERAKKILTKYKNTEFEKKYL